MAICHIPASQYDNIQGTPEPTRHDTSKSTQHNTPESTRHNTPDSNWHDNPDPNRRGEDMPAESEITLQVCMGIHLDSWRGDMAIV